jgi:hypothetical protein
VSDNDDKIERLLRSAALAGEDIPAAPPFGFETRLVALWRSSPGKLNGMANLLRRVALLSAAVTLITAVAAFREVRQSREIGESFSNEFAIADSAIQSEFGR